MVDTDQLLYDLFQAYYDARKHKRNTIKVAKFEMNYEAELFKLHQELVDGTYTIRPSTCFIINDPVQREVFAADFRDRIVHHLVYNYLSPLYEKLFIYDSYSCRKGKGTHFGIQRVKRFMRAVSENFTKEAWILKLDVKGFFMGIDKKLLYQQIATMLALSPAQKEQNTSPPYEMDWVLKIVHQIIFHDPTQNVLIRGKKSDRIGLPSDKSLFCSGKEKGLAIGNLTSQLFANVCLHSLDIYIKYTLGFCQYGRYVDDFILLSEDKQKLLDAIPLIRSFLSDQLHLTLHPKKIYLQPVQNGVLFLGAYIKPYRSYLRKRTIGKWYQKIQLLNQTRDNDQILSMMNSYLGMCQHHKSYRICKKLWKQCNNRIRNVFVPKSDYSKIKPLVRKLSSSEVKKLYPQGYANGNLR